MRKFDFTAYLKYAAFLVDPGIISICDVHLPVTIEEIGDDIDAALGVEVIGIEPADDIPRRPAKPFVQGVALSSVGL
jgi:hypothetical protein